MLCHEPTLFMQTWEMTNGEGADSKAPRSVD
jgi:hypothetical protein